jgi:hypothetical protein
LSDVAKAIASAADGDTVAIPGGTATWTRTLRVRKGITLQGAGVGTTIIRDAVQSDQLIDWTLAAGYASRLTGIEFQDGGRINGGAAPGGVLHVDGSNTDGSTFRWDHCYWNNINGSPVLDTVIGVIDHNTFYVARNAIMLYFYGTHWNGGDFGDGSWAVPANYGSSQFTFVEDCTFTFNVGGLGTMTDAYAGARFVIRHNTIHDGVLNNHGTESTGRVRGSRCYEAYNNTYIGSGWNKFVAGCRSGGVLFHDNSISGYWGNNATAALGNYRTHMTFVPWGGADGANPWDDNYSTIYFTGTASTNSSGTAVTVSGSPGWTTNQWVGYSIRRLTNVGGLNTVTFALINSNTSNTITYSGNGGYAVPSLAFTSGDSLEIRRIRNVMDGIGRGGGSLISGNSPIMPAGWNDQITEPCYAWNNPITDGGGFAVFGPVDPTVRINEHYFNNTPMPGYAPYTYPHPLVAGAAARATVADFDGDGSPDFVLQNPATHQTAIWYLSNNVWIGSAYGPTLPNDWGLRSATDFNGDGHSDYALFNSVTAETGIWYLSGPTLIASAYGPSLPSGWEFVATADFNGDGHPDYVLYNASTRQTAIWYMNNNIWVGSAYGLTLPPSWNLIGVADFNGDGHPDYAVVNSSTGQTAICYLSGLTLIGMAVGPIIPGGWAVVATADFNGDGKPDFVLYNSSTRQTAIWYLNDNVWIGSAYGPTVSFGWSLVSP